MKTDKGGKEYLKEHGVVILFVFVALISFFLKLFKLF